MIEQRRKNRKFFAWYLYTIGEVFQHTLIKQSLSNRKITSIIMLSHSLIISNKLSY